MQRILRSGHPFAADLRGHEIDAIEERLGFRIPPDLRDYLEMALLLGDGFPDWQDPGSAHPQRPNYHPVYPTHPSSTMKLPPLEVPAVKV